jgi:hypothetical protein
MDLVQQIIAGFDAQSEPAQSKTPVDQRDSEE